MAQSEQHKVTWSSIVGSIQFRQGVIDFQLGNPFPSDYDRGTGMFSKPGRRWSYERGRLFAASCAGRNIPVPKNRDGRRVSRHCISVAAKAYQAGDFT